MRFDAPLRPISVRSVQLKAAPSSPDENCASQKSVSSSSSGLMSLPAWYAPRWYLHGESQTSCVNAYHDASIVKKRRPMQRANASSNGFSTAIAVVDDARSTTAHTIEIHPEVHLVGGAQFARAHALVVRPRVGRGVVAGARVEDRAVRRRRVAREVAAPGERLARRRSRRARVVAAGRVGSSDDEAAAEDDHEDRLEGDGAEEDLGGQRQDRQLGERHAEALEQPRRPRVLLAQRLDRRELARRLPPLLLRRLDRVEQLEDRRRRLERVRRGGEGERRVRRAVAQRVLHRRVAHREGDVRRPAADGVVGEGVVGGRELARRERELRAGAAA